MDVRVASAAALHGQIFYHEVFGIDVAALVLSELVCIQGLGDREGHDIHDRIPSDGKERNHIGIEP